MAENINLDLAISRTTFNNADNLEQNVRSERTKVVFRQPIPVPFESPSTSQHENNRYLVRLSSSQDKELGYPNWGTCCATTAFFAGIAMTYLPSPLDSHPWGVFIKFMTGGCFGGGVGATSSVCFHKLYKVYIMKNKSCVDQFVFVREKDIHRVHNFV